MKGGIVRRVLFLGVIPVSIVSVMLSLYFTSTRFDALEASLRERGFAIVRQLAPASEYGVFSGNREVLQRLAEAALIESDVRSVAIMDRDGRSLARSGESLELPPGGPPPGADAVMLAEQGVSLVFSAPILRAQITLEDYLDQTAPHAAAPSRSLRPPEALGTVHVKISRASLLQKKVRLLLDAFLITLAGLGLGAAFALRLGREVTRPIQNLTQAVERIGQGDLAVRIEARSTGELRVLEEGIDAMADSLQALRDNLEGRIAQATGQLAEKKEEAERANAAKSRFLAAASHDLRQPIHALGLFVSRLRDLAEQGQKPEIPAKFGPVIGKIEDSLAAIDDLLDALLDISRLDAGALAPSVAAFPIQRVFNRVESEYAAIARNQGLRFRVRPSSAMVYSDPVLIERIVRNLVSNAVRYTAEGGVLIGCRRRGGALRIEVWDTGVGIPEEHRQDVFQEFYQIDNTGRDREKGLGLGLAIVERLTKLLGHPIHLASRVGRGSVFALEVPLAPDSGAPLGVQEAPSAPSEGLAGAVVYVIEDDALVLDGMRELLQNWGCTVVAAASGAAARQAIEAGGLAPDLVVCDYRLGEGENGLDVIQEIRKRQGRTIPAVLVSGDTDRGLPARAQEAECHLLQKPVRPAKLRALLTYQLNRGSGSGAPGGAS